MKQFILFKHHFWLGFIFMVIVLLLNYKTSHSQIQTMKEVKPVTRIASSVFLTGVSFATFDATQRQGASNIGACYMLSGALFATAVYFIFEVINVKPLKIFRMRPKTYKN